MVWRRACVEYIDNAAASNGHIWQGPILNPGETLTRLRFSWQATTEAPTYPSWSQNLACCMGAIVLPDPATAADVPDPFLSPNEDWVWWEAGWFLSRAVKQGGNPSVVQETDTAPPDGGRERDVRAQRKADPVNGSHIWFVSATGTSYPNQARHYLSLAYSVGVLLP